MNKTIETFFALLRSAIAGTNEEINLADVNYEALFLLSKIHDLAHIVFFELNKRKVNCQEEIYSKFKQQYDIALFRAIKRDLALNQVRDALEKAAIPFIILKGTYLMELYPETWMRTSADIDILVEPDNQKHAVDALKGFGLVLFAESNHDVSFYTQDRVHVELHHLLLEKVGVPKTTEILNQVWQYTAPIENRSERKLNDEMLYFYHLAHMAKHLKMGGCGVRFFIDLWLLNHKTCFDSDKRESLLERSELSEFAKQSVALSEKWLSTEKKQENNNDLESYERYIIKGGVYCSVEQEVAIRKRKTGNRFVYYLERIFLPFHIIKYSYPILQKLPILLPLCWMLRWLKIFNPKNRERVINEIKIEKTIDDDYVINVDRLMKQLKIV